MKILITGASGLLGKYLAREGPEDAAYTWWTTWQPWTALQMDVCDPSQVSYVFGRVKPDAVIHMAAAGDVDWCERNYQEAWRCNVDGTANVLTAAKDYGARVLLTSTNAVYGGDEPPYTENSPRNPVNAYGRMRARAEDLVLAADPRNQVVRLFLLYGWEPAGSRGNWGSKLLDGWAGGLVDDVWYMPTWAVDAAIAIWWILGIGEPGAWNVAGPDRVSLWEFGRAAGVDAKPIPFSSLKGLTARPLDSSYDTTKAKNLGISCRGVREGLAAMRGEIA